MIYILNSPVLTSYGQFEFRGPLNINEVKTLLMKGYDSAIGHQATADILSTLLNINIPVKRQAITMQVGDKALVFRLLTRVEEGVVLDQVQLMKLPYELSVLTKIRE